MLSCEIFGQIRGITLTPAQNETATQTITLITATGGAGREVYVFLLYGNAINTHGKVELRVGTTPIVTLHVTSGCERKIEAPFKITLSAGQTLSLYVEGTGEATTGNIFQGYTVII